MHPKARCDKKNRALWLARRGQASERGLYVPEAADVSCGEELAIRYIASTFTAQTLYSGTFAVGSSAAFVSQLELPSWKWNGIHV